MLTSSKPLPFGFSGGQVDSASPFSLESNQVIALRNLIPVGKKVITRPAIALVNPGGLGTLDPASYKLRSVLMHVDPESSAKTLIAGCYAGFAKLNAAGIFEAIPVLSGLILGSYRPWSRCQTLGASYWCREDSGGILRADPAAVGRVGITQPSTAPTLADGGAGGAMDAGAYKVVVRFRNSRTGAISNYSDPSGSVTIVVNHKLTVTNIPISSEWQVDSRQIGVTIANRPGTYYLAATISDNLSTSVTFNVTPSQMGAIFDRRNDPPPGNAKFVAWWDAAQALVTTDGKALFVSETGLPESFSDNIYDFGADDGFEITGLLPIGQRVLVGKPNRVDMLSGLERKEFRKDMLTDNYGVASGLSMKAVGSTAFWLAQAKDGLCVVRADGSTITTVSDDKIDALLASVPEEFLPHVEGWIYPLYNLYCLSLSRGQYLTESRYIPEVVAAYDYKAGRWTTFDFDPRFMGQPASGFPTQNLAPLSYCDWRSTDGEIIGYLVFDYSGDTSDADVPPRKPWEYVYSLTATGSDTGGPIPWSAMSRGFVAKPAHTHKPAALNLREEHTNDQTASLLLAVKCYKNMIGGLLITDSWQFYLPDLKGPAEHRLPILSVSTRRLGSSYKVEVSGTGYVELHDDSTLEMAESVITNKVLSVAATTAEEPGG